MSMSVVKPEIDHFIADDPFDSILTENVHPSDWKQPTPSGTYNLAVLGGGTAGLVAAAAAAGLGAKVALIEKHMLGGDCLNYGCVPSKAVIRCARAAAEVQAASEFGVRIDGDVSPDFSAVLQRMRKLRSKISHHDSAERFQALGVDVFLGTGRFTGPHAITVDDQTITFRKAMIATGTRPAMPDIPGLEEAGYLTNETVFSLTSQPERMLVIGAGPIGCELSQAFARLGVSVTLLPSRRGVLPREERVGAEVIRLAMEKDGVTILDGFVAQRIEPTPTGRCLIVERDGRRQAIDFDAILLAVGRTPNVENLGLEAAGVTYDPKTGVQVDKHLRTANPDIYAAGDICSRFKFTHAADAMARVVLRNALFLGRSRVDRLIIPWCTYTSPEIAHVGLHERDAHEHGLQIDTFMEPLSNVDRAVLDGQTSGFLRVHVRRGTDRLLGATLVAEHAGEMIAEIGLAMANKIGLSKLADTIHPYPTVAEVIRRIGDSYNRTRLTPRVKTILQRWLAWQVR